MWSPVPQPPILPAVPHKHWDKVHVLMPFVTPSVSYVPLAPGSAILKACSTPKSPHSALPWDSVYSPFPYPEHNPISAPIPSPLTGGAVPSPYAGVEACPLEAFADLLYRARGLLKFLLHLLPCITSAQKHTSSPLDVRQLRGTGMGPSREGTLDICSK